MASAPRKGEDRLLTVPNALTVVRLACVPVFVWLLALPGRAGWLTAALLLSALGLTDFLDGWVARHFNQVSTVGKVLDPVADRLVVGAAAIGSVVVGAVPGWLAAVVLLREGLVAAGTLALAAAGGRRIDVAWAGKAGTFGLMCALPLFLASYAGQDWHEVTRPLAWAFVLPALVLAWFAAATYAPQALNAVSDARRQARIGGSQH
jgi:cardiolipin synthase